SSASTCSSSSRRCSAEECARPECRQRDHSGRAKITEEGSFAVLPRRLSRLAWSACEPEAGADGAALGGEIEAERRQRQRVDRSECEGDRKAAADELADDDERDGRQRGG